MPIDVEWDDAEKTIVRQTYSDQTSLSDYYDSVKRSFELISSVDYPVDVIIDLRGRKSNIHASISVGRYTAKHVPPNQRFVMLVGVNLFIRSLINILTKVLPNVSDKLAFVDTLDEARRTIQEKRKKNNVEKT